MGWKMAAVVFATVWVWSVLTVLMFFGTMWLFSNVSDLAGAIGLVTFAVIEATAMLFLVTEGFTESPVRRSRE